MNKLTQLAVVPKTQAGGFLQPDGNIDLQRLAEALDDAEYDQWLVYEGNRQGKEPIPNLERIEKIVSLRK